MAFTYSGDPASSDRDLVRFLIGDVTSTSALYQDAEIDAIIATAASPHWAAVSLVDTAIARFAYKADRSIDGLSVRYSSVVSSLKTLREALVRQAETATSGGRPGAAIYIGGLSEAERDTDELNTALSQPAFRRNQFSNETG